MNGRNSVSYTLSMGFPGGSVVQILFANAGYAGDTGSVPELGRSLEEEMTTHSSILA